MKMQIHFLTEEAGEGIQHKSSSLYNSFAHWGKEGGGTKIDI